MPDPNLVFYESTDTTPVTSLTFAAVAPGTPTAAQEVHLWNDKGDVLGSDSSLDMILRVLARQGGSGDFSESGLEVLDRKAVQVRLIGSQGTAIAVTTAWKNLGATFVMDLQDLPKDSAIEMEVRINAPSNMATDAVDVVFRVERSFSDGLAKGAYEQSGAGIYEGLGDGAHTMWWLVSDVVEDDAGAGADVDIPDLSWVYEGQPNNVLTHEITFTNLDGSAAALGAGEAYAAAITAGADGTLTVTKGDKVTAPPTEGDRPLLPNGELLLAWVNVPFGLVIQDSDIVNVYTLGHFAYVDSGLELTVGAGKAIVGDHFIRHTSTSAITLGVSDTWEVFLLEDGSLDSTNDGSRASDRALLLYEVTTDGSAITAVVDKRIYLQGSPVNLVIPKGSDVAVNDFALWAPEGSGKWYIPPGKRIRILTTDPSPAGASSGDTVVDLERVRNGTPTTLFTSQGTDDRRCTLLFTDDYDDDAFPEVLDIQPGDILRAIVDAIPTGGAPSDIIIALPIEEIDHE